MQTIICLFKKKGQGGIRPHIPPPPLNTPLSHVYGWIRFIELCSHTLAAVTELYGRHTPSRALPNKVSWKASLNKNYRVSGRR